MLAGEGTRQLDLARRTRRPHPGRATDTTWLSLVGSTGLSCPPRAPRPALHGHDWRGRRRHPRLVAYGYWSMQPMSRLASSARSRSANLPPMSPVSRGRRPKKGSKRRPQEKTRSDALRPSIGPPESALATLARALGGGARPAWFDGAIERVLSGAGALTTARNARELDQRVAELVGAELSAALQSGFGLRFEWWFGELLDAAVEQVEQGDDPARRGVVWLLYGLAAQRGERPAELLRRTRKAVRNRPAGACPGGWTVRRASLRPERSAACATPTEPGSV
jgi:hypothetical protein